MERQLSKQETNLSDRDMDRQIDKETEKGK